MPNSAYNQFFSCTIFIGGFKPLAVFWWGGRSAERNKFYYVHGLIEEERSIFVPSSCLMQSPSHENTEKYSQTTDSHDGVYGGQTVLGKNIIWKK